MLDVLLFDEKAEVWANRIDVRIIDKKEEKVILIEMRCPWIKNHEVKAEEKTRKNGPLQLELKKQYPGYKITQYNIILGVLGRSKEVCMKSRWREK